MAKAKILLIEDDLDQIDLYTAKFTLEGFDLISAENGLEGVAKAISENPDLILCDIVMDDISGLAVLAKLKSDKKTKNIPVVILTNLSDNESIVKAEEAGAIGFWAKTEILPQELVSRVKEILKI